MYSDASRKVVILSGGIGGARFASGYVKSCPQDMLCVIGNVADDEEFHGLWVSPDMDTLTYTLAGVEGPYGWGVRGDTYHGLGVMSQLGADSWMTLGDKDFALHIYRTERRRRGDRATDIAASIARAMGVEADILPATDSIVQTRFLTDSGELSFQEYFVRERTQPNIQDIHYEGIEVAEATPEVLKALAEANVIFLAPSNPIVSLLPILNIPGVAQALRAAKAPKIAISPFIGGKSVKGPAVEMMKSQSLSPDADGLIDVYDGLLDALIIDTKDKETVPSAMYRGLLISDTDILMTGKGGREQLATFAASLGREMGEVHV